MTNSEVIAIGLAAIAFMACVIFARKTRDPVQFLVGTATVVVVGLYTYFAYEQADSTREAVAKATEQTKLMRDNNIVSQRAFVYAAPTAGFAAFDVKDRTAKLVGMNVPFINSGNTPTKDLELLLRCVPSVEALAEPWAVMHNETKPHSPAVIPPHGNTSAMCTFQAEQFIQVKRGAMHAYVMAEVTYRDRLDPTVRHVTQAEWELSNPLIDDAATTWNGAQWANIGKHNCADEDCPPN